ncbi:phospholipid transport system transporter-binding protein [Halomonas fontilapidosi]|uniref:Phospholipid transport system transporter-binding protein n=1 Tax=Halomonas fontilapidosi TaxID=616675 RepID=A0A7W5DJC9_9GAMM|nr:STAS domain-containing protein [Halomonas fontilapidosi]MBB3183519.1 phospholipid transport system transporter-binding protein [Halomonas fontilapidosi]
MSVLLEQHSSSLEVDGSCLAVTGEVGFEGASAMAGAGSAWLAEQPSGTEVVFDLSGVGRVSSAALSVLLEWTRQARDAGVEVAAVRLSVPLERLTRVAGLDTLLPLAEPATA